MKHHIVVADRGCKRSYFMRDLELVDSIQGNKSKLQVTV